MKGIRMEVETGYAMPVKKLLKDKINNTEITLVKSK